jgi:isoleucyl-tRNA synthetase
MAAVQRIVRLGRAARSAHDLKTRQPLAAVTLVTSDAGLHAAAGPYLDIVRDELNVHEVHWAERRSDFVRHEVKPVFPRLGPRFGRRMPAVKAALGAADGDTLAAQLEQTGVVAIDVDGTQHELDVDDVEIELVERDELATQGDRELLVALNTHLTPDLIAEGWAREVVHRVQSARKKADLDYADRIRVFYHAAPQLRAAIDSHTNWIAAETLATEVQALETPGAELASEPVDGLDFALRIERMDSTED